MTHSVDDILASLGEAGVIEETENDLKPSSKYSFVDRLNDFFIDRQPVPVQEKAYFFHLLSVMLDAGIPMLRSLQILSHKTKHRRFRRVIQSMAKGVQEGQKLSEVMAKFPGVFDDAEVGVIKSGESIGRLDLMLERLSDQLDRAYAIYLKLRGALTYPIVVMVTLVVATLVVMTMVIPKMEVFFEQNGGELPFLTRLVLGLSEFGIRYWWLLFLGALGAFVGIQMYSSTATGRYHVDYWKLKLPLVGGLIRRGFIAKFVRLLGMLNSAGLPINKIIGILSDSMGNSLYELKLKELKGKVEKGEKISTNLATTPFLFPDTVTQMISIGESSATLDESCEKLSNHYEREIEHAIKSMMTVLEPLVIILVGGAVAVLALAILGPVFSLSEVV